MLVRSHGVSPFEGDVWRRFIESVTALRNDGRKRTGLPRPGQPRGRLQHRFVRLRCVVDRHIKRHRPTLHRFQRINTRSRQRRQPVERRAFGLLVLFGSVGFKVSRSQCHKHATWMRWPLGTFASVDARRDAPVREESQMKLQSRVLHNGDIWNNDITHHASPPSPPLVIASF